MQSTATIDDVYHAHGREGGFAAALARAGMLAASEVRAQRPTADPNKIYRLGQGERPPAVPMDSVRRDAQAKFQALLREKTVKRANDKRALGRSPRFVASEMIRLREEVFAENPGLREAMIREANEGRGKFGLRPQGR